MRELGEAAVEEPQYRTWPLVVAVIVAIVLAVAVLPSLLQNVGPMLRAGDWGSVLGYVEGSSLATAGIVWLVLYFAYVRRRRPESGLTHFIILFVIASAVDIVVLAFGYWGASHRAAVASGASTVETNDYLETALVDSRNATEIALDPWGGSMHFHIQLPG